MPSYWLKAGVTLGPGAVQVGMMRAGDPGTLDDFPTISLTTGRRHGDPFTSCWVRTLSWSPPLLFRSHSLCAWGSPHWELEAKKEGLPHLEISVCLVPDFFHFRICFQLLCNYRYKKKKISNATERYKIRHPTLWNLQLIIVNQVVST